MSTSVDVGQPELDAVVQLSTSRSHEFARVGESERDKQQAGLVDVGVVTVDNDDLHRVAIEDAAQPVCRDGSTGAATEDH